MKLEVEDVGRTVILMDNRVSVILGIEPDTPYPFIGYGTLRWNIEGKYITRNINGVSSSDIKSVTRPKATKSKAKNAAK